MRKGYAALALAILIPVVAQAPPARLDPNADTRGLDAAAQRLRASGEQGWDLVQAAVDAVDQRFTAYSCWHLWEPAWLAYRNGRGFSDQYNHALGYLLRALGFEVEVVHAARVRRNEVRPWWRMGYTWLRVTHDGRIRDVSAGREGTVGNLAFTPLSESRRVHPWTTFSIRLGMTPLVVAEIWKSWVAGKPVPSWIYRELD